MPEVSKEPKEALMGKAELITSVLLLAAGGVVAAKFYRDSKKKDEILQPHEDVDDVSGNI